jgi:hypothetical protein
MSEIDLEYTPLCQCDGCRPIQKQGDESYWAKVYAGQIAAAWTMTEEKEIPFIAEIARALAKEMNK